MIIREEYDKFRLNGPLIYKIPWYRPTNSQEVQFALSGSSVIYDVLVFVPELDTSVYDPNVYVKVWDVPWRWYCQSCLAACGDQRNIFKTKWVKREHLEGQGGRDRGGFDSPDFLQRDQMTEHAKQHTIMFQWAKGIK